MTEPTGSRQAAVTVPPAINQVDGSNNRSLNRGFMYRAFVHGYANDKIENTVLKVLAITIANISIYGTIAGLGYILSTGILAAHLGVVFTSAMLFTPTPITVGAALFATVISVIYLGKRTIFSSENVVELRNSDCDNNNSGSDNNNSGSDNSINQPIRPPVRSVTIPEPVVACSQSDATNNIAEIGDVQGNNIQNQPHAPSRRWAPVVTEAERRVQREALRANGELPIDVRSNIVDRSDQRVSSAERVTDMNARRATLEAFLLQSRAN